MWFSDVCYCISWSCCMLLIFMVLQLRFDMPLISCLFNTCMIIVNLLFFRIFGSLAELGCVLAALFWLLLSWLTISLVSHHYFQHRQAMQHFHLCLANGLRTGGSDQHRLMDDGRPAKICVWFPSKHWRSWFVEHLGWVKNEWQNMRDLCSSHIARNKMQRLLLRICCICCHYWRLADIPTMHQTNFWYCLTFSVVFRSEK